MSTDLLYKICPECQAEYRPDVSRCADCDVDLVHREELERRRAELESFPPASELDCVRVAPIVWIRALSSALEEHDVPHRIEPAEATDAPDGQSTEAFGDVALYGLYVRRAELETAREVDGELVRQLIPEEAGDLADGEEESCPACGHRLPADALECGDCGLSFG